MKSEENLRLRSPDYSESDYAPVSTDRWVITDNCQGLASIFQAKMIKTRYANMPKLTKIEFTAADFYI